MTMSGSDCKPSNNPLSQTESPRDSSISPDFELDLIFVPVLQISCHQFAKTFRDQSAKKASLSNCLDWWCDVEKGQESNGLN